MRVVVVFSAVVIVLLSGEALAQSRTCSDELKACKTRCATTYGFTGVYLRNCQNHSCVAEKEVCMVTGRWRIGRLKQVVTGLQRK